MAMIESFHPMASNGDVLKWTLPQEHSGLRQRTNGFLIDRCSGLTTQKGVQFCASEVGVGQYAPWGDVGELDKYQKMGIGPFTNPPPYTRPK